MKIYHFIPFIILTVFAGCKLWQYDDESDPISAQSPETYLALVAGDTIYLAVDSISQWTDPETGETQNDTAWVYDFDGNPDSLHQWDTLTGAFSTVMSSRQFLHWWGEDSDGEVVGYYYKWSNESDWTYTTEEAHLFFVPIQTDLDIFTFQVKAIDRDSLVDPTPAVITLPIQNSPPEIHFRFRSNPLAADINSDTSFTFPTRTFVWDLYDQDGKESIVDVFYALDSICDSCWQQLDAASYASITLTGLSPGFHTFYAKTRDIAGAESNIIQFPDTNNVDEPSFWKVLPVSGDVLIVDDYPQDNGNVAQEWYSNTLAAIVGEGNFSVWEIGDALPFSATDVQATLSYFKHVIWYSATTGKETYLDASGSILAYILNGGNFFINAPELKDSTFTWFPISASNVINPNGRLLSGTVLESDISDSLDLETSQLIAIRVKHFTPDSLVFSSYNTFYRIDGNIVSAGGKFQASPTTVSGNVVLFSIPLHNGIQPIIEGNGSAAKFLEFLLEDYFLR
ncbi:MAG: hypothetical protein ACE5D8_02505 [Fidelibacterota bacterium]